MPPMKLNPRYDGLPIIELDGPPEAILTPVIRQRQRFAATLAAFDDEQWTHPSRCAGWSARDVIVHLDSTNTFWNFAVGAGLGGAPSQFLADFDPVSSPAALVAASDVGAAELLGQFARSTDQLADTLSRLDHDGWLTRAESPVGHVTVSTVMHHALWDSWIHERDVLLPMGITPPEEADEITATLRYVGALGLAYAVHTGSSKRGALGVTATDPDVAFVVTMGDQAVVHTGRGDADVELVGDAVGLIEALSVRAPLAVDLPDEHRWMLEGLTTIFESTDA